MIENVKHTDDDGDNDEDITAGTHLQHVIKYFLERGRYDVCFIKSWLLVVLDWQNCTLT